MAKIHLKMSTGEEFTVSREFYGGSGPMRDRKSAEVQMGFILTKLAALGTDQGVTVNVSQIVYEWVED